MGIAVTLLLLLLLTSFLTYVVACQVVWVYGCGMLDLIWVVLDWDELFSLLRIRSFASLLLGCCGCFLAAVVCRTGFFTLFASQSHNILHNHFLSSTCIQVELT
jgi:hypothetical protein